jgi:predicted transcriptional regulator
VAKYEEAATLLKSGRSPGAIANQFGISFYSVSEYLYTAVGAATDLPF